MKKQDRQTAIETLQAFYPEAKLGRTSEADLLWLLEVTALYDLHPTKRSMSETLQRYRQGYESATSYSGVKSLNNGDDVAHFLDGMSPTEVLQAAERILGFEDGELQAKYAHLNAGQQRMNGGNRIRAALKREDISTDDLH